MVWDDEYSRPSPIDKLLIRFDHGRCVVGPADRPLEWWNKEIAERAAELMAVVGWDEQPPRVSSQAGDAGG